MVNDKTNINVHRSNGNAQSIVGRKENQFRNSKYSKQYKEAYEQHQEKTSRMPSAFVDNMKDRRKRSRVRQRIKNTRRCSSLAGKNHCGYVCGCKRSQKVEGHDRLRQQQTRQQMMMMVLILHGRSITSESGVTPLFIQ